MTQPCSLLLKMYSNPYLIYMRNSCLNNKNSSKFVGLSLQNNLGKWKGHTSLIASSPAKKHDFHYRKYFSFINLFVLYGSQIKPSLEYCSHIWEEGFCYNNQFPYLEEGNTTITSLFSKKLQPQHIIRTVRNLCVYYRCFHGLYFHELAASSSR